MLSLKDDFMSIRNLRANLADTLESVEDGRIIAVTSDGRPQAVIINIDRFEDYETALAERAALHTMLADAAEARAARNESLDGDEVLAWLDARSQTKYSRPTPTLSQVNLADYLDVDDEAAS